MKAVLEFNLPEENLEFEMCSNGSKAYCVLSEYDNWLRAKIKYEELSDLEYEIYEKCREELRGMLNENNISI